jgi:hypothetical protein
MHHEDIIEIEMENLRPLVLIQRDMAALWLKIVLLEEYQRQLLGFTGLVGAENDELSLSISLVLQSSTITELWGRSRKMSDCHQGLINFLVQMRGCVGSDRIVRLNGTPATEVFFSPLPSVDVMSKPQDRNQICYQVAEMQARICTIETNYAKLQSHLQADMPTEWGTYFSVCSKHFISSKC